VSRSQDRTEKPTERRKREARREGRTARSSEVGAALSMLALLAALRIVGPAVSGTVADASRSLMAGAGRGLGGVDVGGKVMAMLLVGLVPFLGVTMILAIAGGIAQVGFTLAPMAAKPKLSHLSLKKGLKRFKPATMSWELVRTTLKLGLLVAVVWAPLGAWMSRLGAPLGLTDAIDFTGDQVWLIAVRATILALLIAAADYAVVRRRTSKELKLTKQELKEEYKHAEGDPMVRQARRRRALEMSRNRMISEVGLADVVVTNPTRLAVALRYLPGEPAPRVVAKGANKLAARIRGEAYRNGITVLEDKPLARALYRRVKVGRYVPAALFEAVATVLAVAYRRRGIRSRAA
jgi:flagellar biosynthesis protein FlhB